MKNCFIIALAGLLASCGQNSVKNTPTPLQTMTKTTTETTTTPATDIITVKRQGNPSGRTVVLIPGLASGTGVWDDTVAALNDFDIRIVQVAGFAGAPKFVSDGNYTDAVAASINAHLAASPGQAPVVVGHSMGGYVGIKAALESSTAIEALIIVDSLPFLAEIFMPGATPKQAAQSAPQLAKQMAEMSRADFDRQQEAGLSRLVKADTYRQVLSEWAKNSDQATVATVMGELLSSDLRLTLSDISADITVFAAHDKGMGIPISRLESLYETQYSAAPKHEIIIIEDSFHFVMFDQKEVFIRVLQEALTD